MEVLLETVTREAGVIRHALCFTYFGEKWRVASPGTIILSKLLLFKLHPYTFGRFLKVSRLTFNRVSLGRILFGNNAVITNSELWKIYRRIVP